MQKYNKIPAKIGLAARLAHENDISRKPLLRGAEAVSDKLCVILRIGSFPT